MFEQIGTVIIVIVVLVVGAGLGLFAGFVLVQFFMLAIGTMGCRLRAGAP